MDINTKSFNPVETLHMNIVWKDSETFATFWKNELAIWNLAVDPFLYFLEKDKFDELMVLNNGPKHYKTKELSKNI